MSGRRDSSCTPEQDFDRCGPTSSLKSKFHLPNACGGDELCLNLPHPPPIMAANIKRRHDFPPRGQRYVEVTCRNGPSCGKRDGTVYPRTQPPTRACLGAASVFVYPIGIFRISNLPRSLSASLEERNPAQSGLAPLQHQSPKVNLWANDIRAHSSMEKYSPCLDVSKTVQQLPSL